MNMYMHTSFAYAVTLGLVATSFACTSQENPTTTLDPFPTGAIFDHHIFSDDSNSAFVNNAIIYRTVSNGEGETRQSVTRYQPDGTVVKTARYRPDPKTPWKTESWEEQKPALTGSSQQDPPALVARPNRVVCMRSNRDAESQSRKNQAETHSQSVPTFIKWPEWKVGDAVSSYWSHGAVMDHGWYPGRISKVYTGSPFARYDILFDDGDRLSKITPDRIRGLSASEKEDTGAEATVIAKEAPEEQNDAEKAAVPEEQNDAEKAAVPEEQNDAEETAVLDEQNNTQETTEDEQSDHTDQSEAEDADVEVEGGTDENSTAETAEVVPPEETPGRLTQEDYDRLLEETVRSTPPRSRGLRREWERKEGWGRKEAIRPSEAMSRARSDLVRERESLEEALSVKADETKHAEYHAKRAQRQAQDATDIAELLRGKRKGKRAGHRALRYKSKAEEAHERAAEHRLELAELRNKLIQSKQALTQHDAAAAAEIKRNFEQAQEQAEQAEKAALAAAEAQVRLTESERKLEAARLHFESLQTRRDAAKAKEALIKARMKSHVEHEEDQQA